MKELQQPADNCLDAGRLASMRDGELTNDERAQAVAHLAICPDCTADERNLNNSSHDVYGLLSTLGPLDSEIPEPGAAFSGLQARIKPASIREQASEPLLRGQKRLMPRNRRRYAWLTAAVAAVLIILLLLPNASVLANEFLALFTVQHFQPVTVNPQTLGNELVTELQNFSDVQLPSNVYDRSNLSQAELQKSLHFKLLLPSQLPSGVGHAMQFSLIKGGEAVFTFDVAKARGYLARTGQSSVTIPSQLDGAPFSVIISSGAMVDYFNSCQGPSRKGTQCSGGKTFSIVEIPSPVVRATGKASLKDLRDFLLSLPKQSAQMRSLLQQIDLNTGTVPLPIPSEVNAQQVTTHGTSGILLADNSMSLAVVLWQAQGIVYVVAGATNNTSQLLDAANSLH